MVPRPVCSLARSNDFDHLAVECDNDDSLRLLQQVRVLREVPVSIKRNKGVMVTGHYHHLGTGMQCTTPDPISQLGSQVGLKV